MPSMRLDFFVTFFIKWFIPIYRGKKSKDKNEKYFYKAIYPKDDNQIVSIEINNLFIKHVDVSSCN